jgi:hypothetical protein
MAFHAPDAFVHVNAMVEVSKFGQVVNPLPCDRRACPVAGPHELESTRTDPNLLVAVHTDLRRGNACKGGRFDRRVTIPAVDPQLANMMGVAEFDRLNAGDFLLRNIGRPPQDIQSQAKNDQARQRRDNTNFRERVETSMKDLRHAADALKEPQCRKYLCPDLQQNKLTLLGLKNLGIATVVPLVFRLA